MENPCLKCKSYWSASRSTDCTDSCERYKIWKDQTQAKKSITMKELWHIIHRIYPRSVDTNDFLSRTIEAAAVYCFINRLEGLDIEIIRYQLDCLYKNGRLDII